MNPGIIHSTFSSLSAEHVFFLYLLKKPSFPAEKLLEHILTTDYIKSIEELILQLACKAIAIHPLNKRLINCTRLTVEFAQSVQTKLLKFLEILALYYYSINKVSPENNDNAQQIIPMQPSLLNLVTDYVEDYQALLDANSTKKPFAALSLSAYECALINRLLKLLGSARQIRPHSFNDFTSRLNLNNISAANNMPAVMQIILQDSQEQLLQPLGVIQAKSNPVEPIPMLIERETGQFSLPTGQKRPLKGTIDLTKSSSSIEHIEIDFTQSQPQINHSGGAAEDLESTVKRQKIEDDMKSAEEQLSDELIWELDQFIHDFAKSQEQLGNSQQEAENTEPKELFQLFHALSLSQLHLAVAYCMNNSDFKALLVENCAALHDFIMNTVTAAAPLSKTQIYFQEALAPVLNSMKSLSNTAKHTLNHCIQQHSRAYYDCICLPIISSAANPLEYSLSFTALQSSVLIQFIQSPPAAQFHTNFLRIFLQRCVQQKLSAWNDSAVIVAEILIAAARPQEGGAEIIEGFIAAAELLLARRTKTIAQSASLVKLLALLLKFVQHFKGNFSSKHKLLLNSVVNSNVPSSHFMRGKLINALTA
jgi:hypothetical protein